MLKFNDKLNQKVRQYFTQDDSIFPEQFQVSQSEIEKMEQLVNSNMIIIDFSKSYQLSIKKKLQQVSNVELVSFCYLSLKKILDIRTKSNFLTKMIDSYETNVIESQLQNFQYSNNRQTINKQSEQNNQIESIQYQSNYEIQLFENITFYVTIIQERISQNPDLIEQIPFGKPLLYDITQIFLFQYLHFYRIEENKKTFSIEYYHKGEAFLKLVYNQFNLNQVQHLLNLFYNFRTVTILKMIIENQIENTYEVFKSFLSYHYQDEIKMELLFNYEQTLKFTFIDYFLSILNQNTFEKLFEDKDVQSLNTRFFDNCFVLELQWLCYFKFISSNYTNEQIKQQIDNHLSNSKSWQNQLLKLISFGSKRLLALIKNLEKFQDKIELMKWQDSIFDILTNSCQNNQQFDQEYQKQVFTFVLNLLKKTQFNAQKLNQSWRSVQLFEQCIKQHLFHEYGFSKIILDIFLKFHFPDQTEGAKDDSQAQQNKQHRIQTIVTIQQYFCQIVHLDQFSSDPIASGKYILICYFSGCRQKINHIYGSIIKYQLVNLQDSRAYLREITIFFKQMIMYFQKNEKIQNKDQFLSQQIRLSLRSLLTAFFFDVDQSISYIDNDQFSKFYPIINLEQLNYEIVEVYTTLQVNILDSFCVQHILNYLMNMLELVNSYEKTKVEDLYDILICLIKLIQVIQRLLVLNDDLITLNNFFQNLDQSLYKYIVKVLINHQELQEHQIRYFINCFDQLTFKDFLNNTLSSLCDNTEKYFNYRLITIYLSCVFECELPSIYKLGVIDLILKCFESPRLQYPSMLKKIILLLVIHEQQDEIRQKMIQIIKYIFETNFSNTLLKYLLRLCFGGCNKLLIFRYAIPEYQERQQLADTIFENDIDLINIFFQSQLNLLKKYSFEQSLSDFLKIYKSLLQSSDSYIFFKDCNSYIQFPLQCKIQKRFTIYVELEFQNRPVQENVEFQISQEEIPQKNKLLYDEFLTIISKKSQTEFYGFKIDIHLGRIQIRQFKYQNLYKNLAPLVQTYEINSPNQSKYKYQINYQNGNFQVYINGILCKNKSYQFMEINEIVQIDLGKCMEKKQSLSYIFATEQFDQESNYFYGKIFDFSFSDLIQNAYTQEQKSQVKNFITFNKYKKIQNSHEIQLKRECKDLFIIETTQKEEMNSIQYKQKSDVYDVLQNCKCYNIILLILQEIINQKQSNTYENQIIELLNILFHSVLKSNDERQSQFFKQDLNSVIKILQSIACHVELSKFIQILYDFNQKLQQQNQKYFLKFTTSVMYEFSIFEKYVIDQKIVQQQQKPQLIQPQIPNQYFQQLLCKYQISFDDIIEQIIKNPNLKIFETIEYYNFLQSYLLNKFNAEKQQIQKFQTDMQLFVKLFKHQELTDNNLKIIKLYINTVIKNCMNAFYSNLQKYSQNSIMLNQKNDVLSLSALLHSCQSKLLQNQNQLQTIKWNFINLLIFIEDLRKANIQFNPQIVDSLILEIFCFQDGLGINEDVLPILDTILNEIKKINSWCTIINVIVLLSSDKYNNNIDINLKPSLVQLLIKHINNNKELNKLEILKVSKLEFIFDLIQFKDDASKQFFLEMTENKIFFDHLNSADLGRLQKNFLHNREIFNELLKSIRQQIVILVQKKKHRQINIFANIIKLLNLMKQEFFTDEVMEIEKDYSSLLNFFMDFFSTNNCFKINLIKNTNNDSLIENQLHKDGLFGLFAEIFYRGLFNQKYEIVLENIQELLRYYLKGMKKNEDDQFVKDLYGVFNFVFDKNGTKLPIIALIFEKNLPNNKEHLSIQVEVIKKIILEIRQTQEEQLTGNYNFQEQIQNYFGDSSNKTDFQSQYENYKSNKLGGNIKNQNDQRNSNCTATASTRENSLISIKRKNNDSFILEQDQGQINQQNFLYVNFYFQVDSKRIIQFNEFVKDLNQDICQNDIQQMQDYQIKWTHTNLTDYENKIILKKLIEKKNFKSQIKTLDKNTEENMKIFGTQTKTLDQNTQENMKIFGTLISISEKSENIQIRIFENGIQFLDPINNENIVVSKDICKVNIMKYQNQERSFLIKFFEVSFQRLYFIEINKEDQFKQITKHLSNLEILTAKSSSEMKKNVQQKWQIGQISNYQYIYSLNSQSKRNILDKNNYYIFPWTTINFNNNSLIINRKFSQIIYQQTPSNQGYFHSSQNQINYFFSLQGEQQQTLVNFLNELQKLGESIPEIYSNPQLFLNVKLPYWVSSQTPEEFIYIMRAQLESIVVQDILPSWIDLIFGIHSEKILKFQNIQKNQDKSLNKENMIYGQPVEQIFFEKHINRKIYHSYFGDQPQIKFDVKRLLYKGDEKIISTYYYSCYKFILITDKGQAIILDVDTQLIEKMSFQTDSLSIRLNKNLETIQPLMSQQICYIDFKNQNFTDKQESQHHVIETERLILFQDTIIFFIVSGYPNGEFRSFKGNKLKQQQYYTQNKSNIQCLSICHARSTIIIGQEDGTIQLWVVTKECEIKNIPVLVLKQHTASITCIDCSTSQILSVDNNNEARVQFYDGQLINSIKLDCSERITFCQISYTMNLFIFLNKLNKLMAYRTDGQIFIQPFEITQKINNILPLTPFSSQFMYLTDNVIYFDDIFTLKMKSDGQVIERAQDIKIYNYNFQFIKTLKGKKLLLQENTKYNILSTQIIFQQREKNPIRFQTVGCENGSFWCLYNEDDICKYYETKLQNSGLK